MLRELEKDKINQPEPGITRRVFVDDRQYFDLFVWYNATDSQLIGFQLCYGGYHRAITWMKDYGFMHDNIQITDNGYGRWKGIGVLEIDGFLDHLKVAEEFKASAVRIDPEVSEMIYRVLCEPEKYSKKTPA
jgi:hypothetical protein